MSNLMLLGELTICYDVSEVLQLVGTILTILKIAIPLIIIILGIIDLAKAITSSKPEEIKKSATSLLWRFIGAVFIFFLPAIVMAMFKILGPWKTAEDETDYKICYNCIVRPNGQDCRQVVDSVRNS